MSGIEKSGAVEIGHSDEYSSTDPEAGSFSDHNAVHGETVASGNSLYARLQDFAGRLGVEQRGIERVPSDERTDSSMSQVGTLWLSANMACGSFAIGALAIPVFNLGYVDSALTIVFFNLLGILPVCFFSTFGPRFGLRQMVLSRFFFGYHGVKLIAFLNILACLGWSSVNVIVGAQLFHAVNANMPGWVGILIIALSTLLVCTFGYRLIHTYERYAWIAPFVIFLLVLGIFARSGDFNNNNKNAPQLATGPAEAGSVLSFGASIFGSASGWTSYAADYTVYQPATRPRASVFLWTFAGLLLPLCFTQLLGAAVATAVATNDAYLAAYADSHVGGLLAQVLRPTLGRSFGDFCLALLALSIVANNCPNIYSVSLSLQLLTRRAERVPRPAWVLLATAAYVAVSVPAYDHFESALENFMLLIAYWLAVYEGVALAEHLVFRRGLAGYAPGDYGSPGLLPPGFAALAAFACGVAGAVLGMAQVWFVGPVGRLCGAPAFGGDVGFELAFVFAAVSYVGFRTVERRVFGR